MAASDDWYRTCERPDACTSLMLEPSDKIMSVLKSKVFCPNGGNFMDSASGAGGRVVPGSKASAVGLSVAAVIGALV